MLMSKLPGGPLTNVWTTMDFTAKKRLTHEVAVFSLSMFKKQLRGIGNLYSVPKLEESESADGDLPEVQRIVSPSFFWEDHILQSIPRGPFRTSRDWLESRLLLQAHDCNSFIARIKDKRDPDDDDMVHVEDAYAALKVLGRLKLLLDNDDLFPSTKEGDAEPSMLFHGDLAHRNILVDEAVVLTGVVDWECVSALPLWKACDYPMFLEGPHQPEAPVLEQYDTESEEWYWEELMDYETTILREHFLEEMRRLEPGWVKVFEASERQKDFDKSMRSCTDGCFLRHISGWIDDVALGKENVRSLFDRAFNDIPVCTFYRAG